MTNFNQRSRFIKRDPIPLPQGDTMTLKELASKIAKIEGKKKQVSIGNVREAIGIFSDLMAEDASIADMLIKNGLRRLKKKR